MRASLVEEEMDEALSRIDWSVQGDRDLDGASVDLVRDYVSCRVCRKQLRRLTNALADSKPDSPQMPVLMGGDMEDRDTMPVSRWRRAILTVCWSSQARARMSGGSCLSRACIRSLRAKTTTLIASRPPGLRSRTLCHERIRCWRVRVGPAYTGPNAHEMLKRDTRALHVSRIRLQSMWVCAVETRI